MTTLYLLLYMFPFSSKQKLPPTDCGVGPELPSFYGGWVLMLPYPTAE